MKNKSTILAIFVLAALISGNASAAGSKQRPPVAEKSMVSPWYQPVIDLFSIG